MHCKCVHKFASINQIMPRRTQELFCFKHKPNSCRLVRFDFFPKRIKYRFNFFFAHPVAFEFLDRANQCFILCIWFQKICFSGYDFGEVWLYFCCCHRRISPAPFYLFNQSWIHLQWLLFSFTVRIKILFLACDNLHELAALPFLGDPGKTVPISE